MALKERRGGKYPKIAGDKRYFNPNDAGDKREFNPQSYGERLRFEGSGLREFVFSDTIHGTKTITAHSFEEALRIAKSLGYTRNNYKKR